MATKHVIVAQPGTLSAQQLAQIEADYERDLVSGPAEGKPEAKDDAEVGEGEETEK